LSTKNQQLRYDLVWGYAYHKIHFLWQDLAKKVLFILLSTLQMSGKPCHRCGKTAFPLESLKAGEETYHKLCFRCPDSKCNVQLTLKTFKRDPATGNVFCDKHIPKQGHTAVADSLSTKAALSAPKKSNEKGIHKGDVKLAPKKSDQWSNDRHIESGEFEKEAEKSHADTGASWGSSNTESGTFENDPEPSHADVGAGYGSGKVESGTFESTPEPSHASSGGSWGTQAVESRDGTEED